MAAGYIYVLENQAYGAHIVKIGHTNREPSVRAREIYSGATGVPMPFDIAVAYSVSDCVAAEKRVHRRLASYRINRRREFFRLSPSVAASTVYEVCADINRESGSMPPSPYIFPPLANQSSAADHVTDQQISLTNELHALIDTNKIQYSPIGTSTLNAEQLERVKTIGRILARAYPMAHKKWIEGFSRDWNPEREILIWEHIAKAYLSIDRIEVALEDMKQEVFELLLARSMRSTERVLQEAVLRNFTRKRAKQLLDAYELKPKPVVVTDGRTAKRKFGT